MPAFTTSSSNTELQYTSPNELNELKVPRLQSAGLASARNSKSGAMISPENDSCVATRLIDFES